MKKIGQRITTFSLRHYKLVTGTMVGITVLVLLAAGLPSLQLIHSLPEPVKQFSRALGFLPTISVDTDPENMLSPKTPVREFHNAMKQRMDLHDMVVVGVVNEKDPNGVFNPGTLKKIYELTNFAKTLQFDSAGKVIRHEAAAPTEEKEPVVPGLDLPDADEPTGIPGLDAPITASEATPAPAKPKREFRGVIPGDVIGPSTVDSIEPRNGAIVFRWLMQTPPETQVQADLIRRDALRVPFLNGTMVSEDGKAIALYLPITEKNLSYNVYRALQDKIAELGEGPEQFYITGLPVAEDTFGVEMFVQMAISAPAAMVVIFVLMLLFFRKIILVVSPMIVAMVSVILTMGALILCGYPIHIMSSMIPIFIMPIAVLDSIHILSEFFEKYQATRDRVKTMQAVMDELFSPMLYTSLTSTAGFASLALTPIPPVQVFGLFVAAGIMIAWVLTVTFIPAFVMFISPKRLENFGAVHKTADDDQTVTHTALSRFLYWLGGAAYRRAKFIIIIAAVVLVIAGYGISRININDNPVKWFAPTHPIRVADRVLNDHFGGTYMAYLSMQYKGDEKQDIFKRPDVLRWQEKLQQALKQTGVVGKSNSLADIVKTVHRDLLAQNIDDPKINEYFTIPNSSNAVAECLIQFESSHRPGDLAHFVTVNGDDAYKTSSLWVQLTSGDNKDMEKVLRAMDKFLADNPPPVPLDIEWFGLTYINVIWQNKMVVGMMEAFAGSFLVVFLLMVILFRSVLWGLLSMIPLTVTIAGIYGAVGLLGKDYDMPVAVLSSLTLGLAVDFSIHFLARARAFYAQYGSWQVAAPRMFGEPARAITRNIIVIAAGFLPLLLAPLMPYRTVGVLLSTIMLVSGVSTLLLLPALMAVLEKWLFKGSNGVMPSSCNCGLCVVTSITTVVLIAMNFYSYSNFGWGAITWVSGIIVVVLAVACGLLSRRAKCRMQTKPTEE